MAVALAVHKLLGAVLAWPNQLLMRFDQQPN
jgi:hypothetical protein